jgi:hypothetical protein
MHGYLYSMSLPEKSSMAEQQSCRMANHADREWQSLRADMRMAATAIRTERYFRAWAAIQYGREDDVDACPTATGSILL